MKQVTGKMINERTKELMNEALAINVQSSVNTSGLSQDTYLMMVWLCRKVAELQLELEAIFNDPNMHYTYKTQEEADKHNDESPLMRGELKIFSDEDGGWFIAPSIQDVWAWCFENGVDGPSEHIVSNEEAAKIVLKDEETGKTTTLLSYAAQLREIKVWEVSHV